MIHLFFVDGGKGDDITGTQDYRIVDQGGPAQGGIPTLTDWGIIGFVIVTSFVSIYFLKRRKKTS